MPAAVKTAIVINVVALVIACIRDLGVLSFHRETDIETQTLWFAQPVFGFVFVVVFQILIAKRQNWARIVWSVLAVLSSLLTLILPEMRPPSPPVFALAYFGDLILRAVGVACLFQRSANQWFAGRTGSAAGAAAAVIPAQAATVPDGVKRAIQLSAAGVVVGILRDVADLSGAIHESFDVVATFGSIVLFCAAAVAFLNYIARGARWARTAWSITVGVRAFFALLDLRGGSCAIVLLSLLEMGLEIGGATLLYRDGEWFA